MHVSLLAGLPVMPSESSESEERIAALVLHHHGVDVVGAALLRKRRNAQLFNGASFLHGVCNGEWG